MKFNFKSIGGLLIAGFAGIMAFYTEIDNQKKDKELKDLKNRVINLEKKES